MRREYGKGSLIYVDTLKRYVARVRVNGKVHKKTFKNRGNAEEWLKYITDNGLPPTDLTLGVWLSKYIDTYRRPFLRPRSLERLNQAAEKWSSIYDIKLKDLKPHTIQLALNNMDGLSKSSIKKSYDLIIATLNQAVAERMILFNPALSVTKPKTDKSHRIELLTKKEIGKMLWALRKLQNNPKNSSQRYDMILFFKLLLTTGVRVSELLSVKWCNVDSDKHTIKIEGSKDLDTQNINAPKTDAGYRVVPLFNKKTRDALYKLTGNKNDFVFCNKNGGAMSYHRAYITWNNARKLSGVTKGIHSLRHTAISYMLTVCNIPLAQVSSIAGHSSPAITLSIYTHAINEYKIGTQLVHIEKPSTPKKSIYYKYLKK
jgi:integrase